MKTQVTPHSNDDNLIDLDISKGQEAQVLSGMPPSHGAYSGNEVLRIFEPYLQFNGGSLNMYIYKDL